jgi:aminoglycoside 6'-N-acetyltransferase
VRGRVTLRKARIEDAAILSLWDRDEAVIASHGEEAQADEIWRDEEWADEIAADPPWRTILIGEEDGRPVGAIVDIDPALEETHYWGDCGPGLRAFDTWIGAAADRSRGIGAQMMSLALFRAFEDPSVQSVIIDPIETNRRAIRFYERCGFRALERRRFGHDDCLVMRIDRNNFHRRYLSEA